MSLASSIYNQLPVSIQNIGISIYGYRWQKRRFGGVFNRELEGFQARETFSTAQWNWYVNEKLQQLLQHAMETVPHYRNAWRAKGFSKEDISRLSLEQLSSLPFLEKNQLREYGATTLLSSQREASGEFFASSGSTGTPTQILFSHAMHQRWSAGFEARIRHWAGVDRFTPRGMIGGRRVVPDGNGRPPFYRYNIAEKQTYFSAYHISSSTVKDYVNGMRRNNVQYMTGYAMSNFFLARFIQEAGISAPAMKAVIASSEKLTPEMRSVFSDVYQCKTYDSWSGVEACGLVSECEHGSLHVSPDMGIIELLDEYGRPVGPGEVGEVVCTGLLNFDQPLIRYRIGDMMRLGTQPCVCGRNMPVIDEIIGRVEDVVVGKDGREMVRFHGIFVGLPNIVEAQVIQEDYDRFIVRVVANDNFSNRDQEVIRQRMYSQLGEIVLEINKVQSIPRNKNGKFQAVISKVKRSTV